MSTAVVVTNLSTRSMLKDQVVIDDDNNKVLHGVLGVKQPMYEEEFKNCKARHEDASNKKKEWKSALDPMVIENGTIDGFYELFLSDDAPNSIKMYQTDIIGDTDVNVDVWRNAAASPNNDDVESESLERDITYLHSLMGGAGKVVGMPTAAETLQHQSWKRYGNVGAVLKTTTKVGNRVPMADCFYVENEWLIEQKVDTNNAPCITLSVKVRMVFIKRTMLQGIITKNVMAETKRWFDGYKTIIVKELSSATEVAAQ